MAAWIWVLIPLVAIIGAFILDYQKNKMKMMTQGRQNEQEVEEIRKLMESMKKRIENLEAIAAGDPDEFSTGAGRGMSEIEIDVEEELKRENKERVSEIANKKRAKS